MWCTYSLYVCIVHVYIYRYLSFIHRCMHLIWGQMLHGDFISSGICYWIRTLYLLDIWRVEKVDESLWYAWLLQHLNVRLREVHWFTVLYLWQCKETAATLGPSNGEFAGEGTVQKEIFQEGEEIGRGDGQSAWPGNQSIIISIFCPACCETTVLRMALTVLQEESAEQGWDSFSVVISHDLQMYIKACCSCHFWWFCAKATISPCQMKKCQKKLQRQLLHVVSCGQLD